MKLSKQMVQKLRDAKGEKEIASWLRHVVKDYELLDKQDWSVISDAIGMLKQYGWKIENRNLVKDNKVINMSKLSFK